MVSNTVGILRHYFLPKSETFIYRQLAALTVHRARVFCIAQKNAERFPFPDVYQLKRERGLLAHIAFRVFMADRHLDAWVRQHDIRLLHAHMGYTGVWGVRQARKGLPLFVSYYGRDVTLLRSLSRFHPEFLHYTLGHRGIFRHASKVIVLSEHMKGQLVEQGCPESRLAVIRLAADHQRFRPPAERPAGFVVLMVGRMVEKKGFADGLRAFALFRHRQRVSDSTAPRLIIIGYGELETSLRQLARKLAIDDCFDILGPGEDVARWMGRAHVLLTPSKTARNGDQEGTPTVICEGACAELPVVATHHAGIPEQVDEGRTGFLVDEGDVEGLAERLERLYANPSLREEFGRAGRQKMLAEYNLTHEVAKLESLYSAAMV
jgi:colanic acid/amylovoran biosynthesis glycosyltransferase